MRSDAEGLHTGRSRGEHGEGRCSPVLADAARMDVVRKGFRKCFLWDAAMARAGAVGEYQVLFPGFERIVADEYERLSSEQSPPSGLARPSTPATIGPYRLERFLGRGGQGTVYLATDSRSGVNVALKLLAADVAGSERRLLRLRREAEAIAQLDHPGICRIHEAALEGDTPYLALHYVPGRTLAEAVVQARRDAPAVIKTIDAGSALGLTPNLELDGAGPAGTLARVARDSCIATSSRATSW
jgi:hypothetical protein